MPIVSLSWAASHPEDTYVGDDRVTIVRSHKVLDLTGRGILELVSADEVVCQVVLRSIGAYAAVHDGHSAVGGGLDPVAMDGRHGVGSTLVADEQTCEVASWLRR